MKRIGMTVTFHGDGGLVIDDPALEQMIAKMCRLTGETPEEAIAISVREALERAIKKKNENLLIDE